MDVTETQIESIFLTALEIQSAEERARFLSEACGSNEELRGRIVQLLAAQPRLGKFLEVDQQPDTRIALPFERPVGDTIGPYKLREQIGEGGMGIVYVAEQEKPLRRKVALKIIKPGMDTKQVIGRFEAERQALALMDHPNIAKIYDAGTTESGRPYFVMELVRGLPITEYCDRAKAGLKERLGLFIQVCQAVQHAHQKGVVHRDLKPSNVMVTLHDGVPVPKVIDFGVAKAINQRLSEHTIYTHHMQMLGTPLYMSPEQAELSGLEIDARSDVYSLGVLLYELLTGTTPFEKETLSKVGIDEMRRMIREDEPPRPSNRLTTLELAKSSTVAEKRGLNQRTLVRALRGDVDWIVMKAMEKDRRRRYDTAAELAADVERYLNDQPVLARPPSFGYRLRKYLHRNRRALTTTALLIVSGMVASYGTMILVGNRQPEPEEIARNSAATGEPFSTVASKPLMARAPGRQLTGLVPDPIVSLEIGRWQLITKKPRGVMRSCVLSPDEQLLALAEANHVRIYDATNMQLLQVLLAHSQPVTSVAWHPSEKQLASCSEDGTVRLWTRDGAPTRLLSGHSGPVYQVAWHPTGEWLASAAADGTVRLWNADGVPVRTLSEGGRHVFGIDVSPNGKLIATAGGDIAPPGPDGNPGDNSVRIWNVATGSLVHKLTPSMKHAGLCVDWRHDGKQIAVGFGEVYRSVHWLTRVLNDAGVQIWSSDGTPGPVVGQEFGSVSTVAWRPDGNRLVFGGRSGIVWIWNADDNSVVDTTIEHSLDLYSTAWNRDGSKLLKTSRGLVGEWDGDKNETVVNGVGQAHGFPFVAWSPDGNTLCGSSFWNATGQPVAAPSPPPNNVQPWWNGDVPTKHPDGTGASKLEGSYPSIDGYWKWDWSKQGWLAGANWHDANVRIWNDQGNLVATLTGHRGGVEGVSWSPDGEWLATGGGDSIRTWKKNGEPDRVMTGHTDEIYPVAWSPDGQLIASGSMDSTIRLWKTDGTLVRVLRGHQGGIMRLAWSPDSKKLASASGLDSTLRVWNVETGKTEWQVVFLAPNSPITLNAAGEAIQGEQDLLNDGLLYIREEPDGRMSVFSYDSFRQRYLKYLVKSEMDQVWPLLELGKQDEAFAIFDRTVAADTNGSIVWNQNIGDYCLENDLNARAVIVYSSIIEHNNRSAQLFEQRAYAYTELKEYEKALADISTAVELNPAGNIFGWYLRQSPFPEELQDAFFDLLTKAVALSPANYKARITYLMQRKDHARAIADLEKAIEVDPDIGWFPIWDLADNAPEVHDAFLELLAKAVALSPKNYIVRIRYLIARGNYKQALADLEKAIEVFPNIELPFWMLQGFPPEFQDALLDLFAKVVVLSPKNYKLLVYYLVERGDFARAVAGLQKALEVHPDIGWFPYWKLPDCPPEIRDAYFNLLTKAVELSPENCITRSQYLMAQGDYGKALADYEKASPNPVHFFDRKTLAILRLAAGDENGYRNDCASLVKDFAIGGTVASAIAWTACLAANAVPDYELPLRLATNGANQERKRYSLKTVGAVLYRAGRYPEAVERLLEAENAGDDGYTEQVAYTQYFLAMTKHRLGDPIEAATWLRKADEAADRRLNEAPRRPVIDERAVLDVLGREAHQLIGSQRASDSADRKVNDVETIPAAPAAPE